MAWVVTKVLVTTAWVMDWVDTMAWVVMKVLVIMAWAMDWVIMALVVTKVVIMAWVTTAWVTWNWAICLVAAEDPMKRFSAAKVTKDSTTEKLRNSTVKAMARTKVDVTMALVVTMATGSVITALTALAVRIVNMAALADSSVVMKAGVIMVVTTIAKVLALVVISSKHIILSSPSPVLKTRSSNLLCMRSFPSFFPISFSYPDKTSTTIQRASQPEIIISFSLPNYSFFQLSTAPKAIFFTLSYFFFEKKIQLSFTLEPSFLW